REGPFNQAFQALLEALQHTHRLLLGFRGLMVSGGRTPRPRADRLAHVTLHRRSMAGPSPARPVAGPAPGPVWRPPHRVPDALRRGEVAEWQTRTVQVRVPER